MNQKQMLIKTALLFALLSGSVVTLAGCNNKTPPTPQQQEEILNDILEDGKFIDGVSVAGVPLGGSTLEEARVKVKSALNAQIQSASVTLTLDGQSWVLASDDLGLTYDIEPTLKEAMALGHTASKAENKTTQETIATQGRDFPITLVPSPSKIDSKLSELASGINHDAIDPTVELDLDSSDRFRYTQGQSGMKVLPSENMAAIENALKSGQLTHTLPLVVERFEPSVTVEELRKNTTRIALATTSYSKSNKKERVFNIKLGLKKIHGTEIAPGQEFSFNKIVGNRNEKNGWQMAPSIVGGNTFEDSYGGGICQVSTTLYNAVIKSDLKVTERNKHSFPSTYVPYGLDAMVSYDSEKDFRFVNNTKYPIFVFTSVDSSKEEISIAIYGRPLPEGQKIRFVSTTVKETDPPEEKVVEDMTAPVGKKTAIHKARKGYTVEVRREVVQGDDVIESKKIYTDTYAPVQGVVSVGIASDGGSSNNEAPVIEEGDGFTIPEEGN